MIIKHSQKKHLPPFGREAAYLNIFNAPPRNDIYLFTGRNSWHKARAFSNNQVVLCLPPGKYASDYSWPVKNCPVLVLDTGGFTTSEAEELAFYLLLANATIVRCLSVNSQISIYRRS